MDNVPVLVGAARFTRRDPGDFAARCPLRLMAEAAGLAAADAAAPGGAVALLAGVDAVATVDNMVDLRIPKGAPKPYTNWPRSLAARLGAAGVADRHMFHSRFGGAAPQLMINELSARIARGEMRSGVVAGAEALATWTRASKAGYGLPGMKSVRDATGRVTELSDGKLLPWGDAPAGAPPVLLPEKQDGPIVTMQEAWHGMASAPVQYALFDQAERRRRGVSVAARRAEIGQLFEGFARVAAAAPEHAWFPVPRPAGEIAEVTAANRDVAFPYTKYMCAVMDVDQAAAVVLMSVAEARRLGVPEERWVYLHGCADASEAPTFTAERAEVHDCAALRRIRSGLAATSGVRVPEDVSLYNIYSCFPSAVSLAQRDLGGLPADGERLTLTGGLPFHGGPGNNYALHGVAAMVHALRRDRGKFGLCTANGGYLTKHSAGVYSTTPYAATHPGAAAWSRLDPAAVQRELDAEAAGRRIAVAAAPSGAGVAEIWTVEFGRAGPTRAIALGRTAGGERFIAASSDKAVIGGLLSAPDRFDVPCELATTAGPKPRTSFTLLPPGAPGGGPAAAAKGRL